MPYATCRCNHPGRKPHYVYPALLHEGERLAVRLIMCDSCFAIYWPELVEHSIDLDQSQGQFAARPQACDFDLDCDKPSSGWVVFVTGYPDRQTRVDRGGRLCEAHVGQAKARFLWGT